MDRELNPVEMLTAMRDEMDSQQRSYIELFHSMPIADQLEFLFHLIMVALTDDVDDDTDVQ